MDPSNPSVCTIRELAAAMNVSASTVSLALHNNPRVAPETRRRVQALALERGYRIDPSVTALMSHIRLPCRAVYRETLAWINAFERPDFFVNKKRSEGMAGYAQALWEGALERAGQLGYQLDMFWLKAPGMTGRRMTSILAARGIRGLLIPPLPQACGHLSIHWSEFSVTAMSYAMARPQFHRVVPDHHYNMQMILRALRRHGYKRIGLLIPTSYHDKRFEGRFLSAFYPYQQKIAARNQVPVFLCEPDFNVAAAAWLKKHQPDAVITLSGFRHVREIDIGNPAYSTNIGVAVMAHGPDDSGFAGMDECQSRLGAAAVDHLSGQLNRNEQGIPKYAETVLIKGTWVEGRTLIKKQAH